MHPSVPGRTIDLEILRENVRAIRRNVPESAMLLAVVKADAYGHGAVQVARAALEAGASWLAVALVQEGVELRKAGIIAPILVLGAALPCDAVIAAENSLTLTVCAPETVHAMGEVLRDTGLSLDVHMKLDTGMSRIGVRNEDELTAVLAAIESEPSVMLTGAFTHFADCDGDDMAFTHVQLDRFRKLTALLPESIIRHCANSAAIDRLMPEAAFDMVRMGITMYGYPPVPSKLGVKPFMSWRTRVTFVKTADPGDTVSYGRTWTAKEPARIATIAIGYGDGYHRAGTGKAQVIIRGRRVPVVGRICMDQIMADVSNLPEVVPGDTVTLLGRDGDAVIDAEEIASWDGTISYEVLLAATGRVRREWLHE